MKLMRILMDNLNMKMSKNWVDDPNISDAEKVAYFKSLEKTHVMSLLEKIDSDKKAAEAELERLLNESKKN